MLTTVVLHLVYGGVAAYGPILLAVLISEIKKRIAFREADDRAVLIKIFRVGSTRMTYVADVAEVIKEDILPTLTRFGIVEIERALFGIKIVLHNCLVLSKCQIFKLHSQN